MVPAQEESAPAAIDIDLEISISLQCHDIVQCHVTAAATLRSFDLNAPPAYNLGISVYKGTAYDMQGNTVPRGCGWISGIQATSS